jgi:hypothetical protein
LNLPLRGRRAFQVVNARRTSRSSLNPELARLTGLDPAVVS